MFFQSINRSEINSADNVSAVAGGFCDYRGQRYYKIENFNKMSDFFMSIVSAYDHWLYLSSNGGLSAGRQNSEKSLFPYYTEDKLTDMAHCTGPLSLLKEGQSIWQPFKTNDLESSKVNRTIYKSILGDRVFFEETRNDLTFQYGWSFSDRFGLVKTTRITNNSKNVRSLSVLDGLQNILPANVSSETQTNLSVLLDAYKSSDIVNENIGIYYLSSRITDLAEPSESLRANVIWNCIVEGDVKFDVSLNQNSAKAFVNDQPHDMSQRVRGCRGSYFMKADINLDAEKSVEWQTVCEVNLDGVAIENLSNLISSKSISDIVAEDMHKGVVELKSLLSKADGLQVSGDEQTAVHHTANSMFNMMRGGIFEDSYDITKRDLKSFVTVRNKALTDCEYWSRLPEVCSVIELKTSLLESDSSDLKRLVLEYLPISFSRRHGDPSRPWNKFSINLKDKNGNALKDFQGNWRDIFQNWEPLAYSYPEFLPSMIATFLNATTADGYNPYRVTRDGIEWEEPDPSDPWGNIGYWSDHQIIYFSKLLELQHELDPEQVKEWFTQKQYSFSNVPYRIKTLDALLENPYDSIEFDEPLSADIKVLVEKIGADGKLHLDLNGNVIHANMTEKLLTLWLAKLSNFVPGGGIWMNTQRPEWNDANNALVGRGLSVVTLAYLHRHLEFMKKSMESLDGDVLVSNEVALWFKQIRAIYSGEIDSENAQQRLDIMKALAASSDQYRQSIYLSGFSGGFNKLAFSEIKEFIINATSVIKESLVLNKRDDNLFHSYNLLNLTSSDATIDNLPVMLEGQVAILSSGLLQPIESIDVLSALRMSDLYREDQHTYLLYPNKQLSEFLNKNNVDENSLLNIRGVESILTSSNLFTQSNDGRVHFNADFRNNNDLKARMVALDLNEALQESLLEIYEQTFQHKLFTGRSGSFFGYEGLGSTYWHMISKLLLAAQECWYDAKHSQTTDETLNVLKSHYYDIRAGIGFNKSPEEYGAFPTDPYSHTPESGIARQPGMTGQVKEELITRLGELGMCWLNGSIEINPGLLREEEFLTEPCSFEYLDVSSKWQELSLPADTLAFTVAQVPFVYLCSESDKITIRVFQSNGSVIKVDGNRLPVDVFNSLCRRDGFIQMIEVQLPIDIQKLSA